MCRSGLFFGGSGWSSGGLVVASWVDDEVAQDLAGEGATVKYATGSYPFRTTRTFSANAVAAPKVNPGGKDRPEKPALMPSPRPA